MRGHGQHTRPLVTQPEPADNTSTACREQAYAFIDGADLIHEEAAREIAAWFATPYGDGAAFTAFATIGLIIEEPSEEHGYPALVDAISHTMREFDRLSSNWVTLHALGAYVRQALAAQYH